jgi:hypothetical protein
VSVNEIKKAIEDLSLEDRLELMQWLNHSAAAELRNAKGGATA